MRRALTKGRLTARLSSHADDILAAQALRHRAFFGCDGRDQDAFDRKCLHLLVEERETGRLVACCRVLALDTAQIGRSYSAQFYELSALQSFGGASLEIGRFCVRPGQPDPDILRLAWVMLDRYIIEKDVKIMFGCSSFPGTDGVAYAETFALLKARHLGPARWRPRIKAPQVVRFGTPRSGALDERRALLQMPPLLRTYLLMGGWVSDHAVIDRKMGTLHVFTGVEIDAIPAARKRLLRAVAA